MNIDSVSSRSSAAREAAQDRVQSKSETVRADRDASRKAGAEKSAQARESRRDADDRKGRMIDAKA